MPLGSVKGVEEVGECNNVQDDDACDHSRLAGHVQGRLRHQALRHFHACDSHAINVLSEHIIKIVSASSSLRGATCTWISSITHGPAHAHINHSKSQEAPVSAWARPNTAVS